MNENQIAFIMCVNLEQEYKESIRYIENLYLPEGFTQDIFTILDAPSMAAGYQAAMENSDAKYKIYMHQDVFMCHRNFIEDILRLFQEDAQIGAIGMIGRRKLPKKLKIAADWDVGNIYFNGAVSQIERQEHSSWPMEVDAVDGLLIATQYDINWRDDIFDGWDFYDISQCMEFKRAGYKIVVPYQEQPWCYHDNHYSRLKNYFFYQDKFCREYQDICKFENIVKENPQMELEALVEQMSQHLIDLVEEGQRQQLWEIMVQMEGKMHLGIRDFKLLAEIDHLEQQNLGESVFWKDEECWNGLSNKINELKFKLKRMEFGLENFAESFEDLQNKYSIFAIAAITLQYASDRSYCIQAIKLWYDNHQIWDLMEIWCQLTKGYLSYE